MSEVESRRIVQEQRYNIRDTARTLGCSTATVWRLVRAGKLGHFRVGARVLVGETHLKSFLERNEHPMIVGEKIDAQAKAA